MNRRGFLAMVAAVPLAAVGVGAGGVHWFGVVERIPDAHSFGMWLGGADGGYLRPLEFSDAIHGALYDEHRAEIIKTFMVPPELIGDPETSNFGTIKSLEDTWRANGRTI